MSPGPDRKPPLDGRHGAGRWHDGFAGNGRLRIIRRLNGHVQVDMRRLLSSLFLVLLFLLVLSRLFTVVTGEPFPISVVSSGSMSPVLERGDLVVWTPTRMSDVHVGDIIVFRSSVQDDTTVAHRVIQIVRTNGDIAFMTKGDANPDPDQAGMHVPEPYITSRNYLGKVVGFDGVPLKVPYVGAMVFWGASLQGDYFGAPGASAYPYVLIPIAAAVAVAMVCAWMMRPEPESKKRTRAVFPTKKMSMKKWATVFLIWYVALLLMSGLWAKDSFDAGVGVGVSFAGAGERRPALYAEYVMPGNVSNASYLFSNPGAMPMNAVAYVEGDGAHFFRLEHPLFTIQGEESRWERVDISIPSSTRVGVHTARIHVFSSPLWMVLPDWFMRPLVEWSPQAAIIMFDVTAALLYTFLSLLALWFIVALSLAMQRMRVHGLGLREEGWSHGVRPVLVLWVGAARSGIRKASLLLLGAGDRLLGVRAAEWRPALLAGSASGVVSLAVYFSNGWSLLELAGVCALSTGIAAVLAGCKYKSEMVLASCVSLGILLAFILAYPGIVLADGGKAIVTLGHAINVLALTLILFLIFLVPVLVIARLTARLGIALKSRFSGDGHEPTDI